MPLLQRTCYASFFSILFTLISTSGAILSLPNFNLFANRHSFLTKLHIQQFLDLRCGRVASDNAKSFCTWYYTGSLRNPLTGNEIAGIEGIELVKQLPTTRIPINQRNATNKHTYLYLSKKLFVYTNPANRSQILKEFRIRPISPKRRITISSKEYHQLISISDSEENNKFGRNVSTQTPTPDISTCQITVNWPGNRTSRTDKMTLRRHNPYISQYDVTNFISGKPVIERVTSSLQSLKRISRWVSFAGMSDLHGKSQEYYSIAKTPRNNLFRTSDPNDYLAVKSIASMSYRRYGESPAWYALKHSSAIELRGHRLRSINEIPSQAVKLIQEINPSFIKSGLSLDEFHKQHDLLEQYPPWYSYLNPWRKHIKSSNATK